MQIRPAHTTDAAAATELLHQLGYPQDGPATTATRIQTWSDDPSSAVYVGVGGRLVAAAESFAISRGCVRMEVTSADRRHDAHEFYRRCDYLDQAGRSSRFLRDLEGQV
jgi:hypothetical protein